MSNVKLRKRKNKNFNNGVNSVDGTNTALSSESESPSTTDPLRNRLADEALSLEEVRLGLRVLWFLLGLAVCFVIGYKFAWYVETMHENNMWFTNIQEVEREISLRTECGLYYSYYKQLVHSPKSFSDSIVDLQRDNATEHGRTINVLMRFNIYQEVVLAWLYKTFTVPTRALQSPMFFYIKSIFGLNGMYVSVLFLLAWYVTGSWLAGVIAALEFTHNLDDTTRVFYTVNLRECFAMPFFCLQNLFICIYLDRRSSALRCKLSVAGIFVSTFLFAIGWQFNQFVLLLQSFALYLMFLCQLAPLSKLVCVLLVSLAAMVCVWLVQFCNPMLLGSLFFSFVPAAVLTMQLFRKMTLSGGILEGSFRVIFVAVLTALATFALNYSIKKLIHLDADTHIFKFIKAKFGFGSPLDFESRIYLCHGAFVFLDNDFFRRTSVTGLFPLYFVSFVAFLFLIGKNVLLEWVAPVVPEHMIRKKNAAEISDKPFMLNQRPYLAFLTLQSAFCGLVALMTLRIKYLWTPHMCVLAGVTVCDFEFWQSVLGVFKLKSRYIVDCVRYALCGVVCAAVLWGLVPKVKQQLEDLREFWDPDTVELMYWVGNNTAPTASFAGSMQLLAGIKCCTGRHLVNHPHFEDKWLRDRTKQVYQIYARQPPEFVHATLKEVHADYIVLEDSICLARSDNCRTPDLIDIENGHIPDNGFSARGLKKSSTPRFCEEIRHAKPEYMKYFRLVLENRTFRVYKVL